MYAIKYDGEAVSISSTESFISETTECVLTTLSTNVVTHTYFVQRTRKTRHTSVLHNLF
jgi:hypothetical protein